MGCRPGDHIIAWADRLRDATRDTDDDDASADDADAANKAIWYPSAPPGAGHTADKGDVSVQPGTAYDHLVFDSGEEKSTAGGDPNTTTNELAADDHDDGDEDRLYPDWWWFPLRLDHISEAAEAALKDIDMDGIAFTCKTGVSAEIVRYHGSLYLALSYNDSWVRSQMYDAIYNTLKGSSGKKGKGRTDSKGKYGKKAASAKIVRRSF